MSSLRFPADFIWGTATSAQQIEGARDADGRGESIWDRHAADPANIDDGSTPQVACDHYRLWREDLERLKWLGVGAYRFSIGWPRILPSGRGEANPAGLDFYDGLVDALLEAGIAPHVTLNHWCLPQPLMDEGGWANRDTVDAFVAYADTVSARLGDRVAHWVTHNEPWCVSILGYEEGKHAPGLRDPGLALRAAHHLLLSHGRALTAIRSNAPGAEAGIVTNLVPVLPRSEDAADLDAARQYDGSFNRWFLDPLFRARYPADVIEDRHRLGHLESAELPFVLPGDMETIAAPLDFLGVNYYSRVVVKAGPDGRPVAAPLSPPEELTEMGWEVYPEGLIQTLERVRRDYGPRAFYVTENGAAFVDELDGDRVRDPRRVAFLRDHIAAAHGAIEAGLPLKGYFLWSLMDNFEWGQGYTKRFGLFRTDYETLERIPKDSAHWYRDTVAANAVDDGNG